MVSVHSFGFVNSQQFQNLPKVKEIHEAKVWNSGMELFEITEKLLSFDIAIYLSDPQSQIDF